MAEEEKDPKKALTEGFKAMASKFAVYPTKKVIFHRNWGDWFFLLTIVDLAALGAGMTQTPDLIILKVACVFQGWMSLLMFVYWICTMKWGPHHLFNKRTKDLKEKEEKDDQAMPNRRKLAK